MTTEQTIEMNELVSHVQEMQSNTTTKPSEADAAAIEQKAAAALSSLPTRVLTKADLDSGKTFTGYLVNCATRQRIRVDLDNTYLYVDGKPSTVTWKISQDAVENVTITAKVEGTTRFFNWRESTGACKLYKSYDRIKLSEWKGNRFQIFAVGHKQFAGTWSSTDASMYVRKASAERPFEFHAFDTKSFTASHQMIFDIATKDA